jgi:hypothetical protein
MRIYGFFIRVTLASVFDIKHRSHIIRFEYEGQGMGGKRIIFHNGDRFACDIPDIPVKRGKSLTPSHVPDISILGNLCISNSSPPLWKYKICFDGLATQESFQGNEKEFFILGEIEKELRFNHVDFAKLKKEDAVGVAPRNFTLKFKRGDFCEKTNSQRRGEVWFQCPSETGMREFEFLKSFEIGDCDYRFIVNSDMFCDEEMRWTERSIEKDFITCRKV